MTYTELGLEQKEMSLATGDSKGMIRHYLYNEDIQGSTTSLEWKEDGSADATHQYTDFGETYHSWK